MYFAVYFLFIFCLILHQMFLPNLKLQVSLLILIIFHSLKVIEYLKNIFNKDIRKKYPWQRN